ncbi:hypothetical protein EUGRSUZ_B03793 [Eucalyptus grandis]|uniref:Uncharacterized protein n=2 Tax=Eucalyptus grandis TaxID=71139 RepID=A0ACC3LXT7_EUCGR|nr:hypothetical protein EUGRSUZ_B03793 [Eucalyptus grandis]
MGGMPLARVWSSECSRRRSWRVSLERARRGELPLLEPRPSAARSSEWGEATIRFGEGSPRHSLHSLEQPVGETLKQQVDSVR